MVAKVVKISYVIALLSMYSFSLGNEVVEIPYRDNNKKILCSYEKDEDTKKADGFFKSFYKNKKIEYEGSFKQGRADGTWKKWSNQGKLLEEIHYDDGKLVDLKEKDGQEIHCIQICEDASGCNYYYHGTQKISLESGKFVVQEFKDGLLDGKWKREGCDGYFKNGLAEGKWNIVSRLGEKFQGVFRNGKMDGVWNGWYKNGKKYFEVSYNEGNEMSWKIWYENGKKMKEVFYSEEESQHTTQTSFYRSGDRLRESGWYENGKKAYEVSYGSDTRSSGYVYDNIVMVKSWHENGQKKCDIYRNGGDESIKCWSEKGKPKLEVHLKDGKMDGKFMEDLLGEIVTGQCKEGEPYGLWERKRNNKKEKIRYEEGEVISGNAISGACFNGGDLNYIEYGIREDVLGGDVYNLFYYNLAQSHFHDALSQGIPGYYKDSKIGYKDHNRRTYAWKAVGRNSCPSWKDTREYWDDLGLLGEIPITNCVGRQKIERQ